MRGVRGMGLVDGTLDDLGKQMKHIIPLPQWHPSPTKNGVARDQVKVEVGQQECLEVVFASQVRVQAGAQL